MATPAMLEGIRIADMSTVIFGPYATQILADMGADVVKIEPPEGDRTRSIGRHAKTRGMGVLHLTINRGKRSVNWDVRSDKGRAAIRKLIETSDVFIHNVRLDGVTRLGLDYESVRAIKPDIVYVHCTGFGQAGPYAPLAAYDDVIQASSGIASLLPRVTDDPAPRYLPMAIADKVSGMTAAYAVLGAIIHKLRTGEGQHVEVPMLESVAAFNLLEHMSGRTVEPRNGPMGYARQVDKERQPFPTSDGYISIAPYVDGNWVKLFTACGHGDILLDERLTDPVLRFKNGSLLNERLRDITPERTTAEWLDLCGGISVAAMRVNDLEELIDDPHLKAVDFLRLKQHPTEGGYYEVRPPVNFSARPDPEIGPAPLLGEHSDALLRELGAE
ncbi:MAG: carnitine dehydratase [Sphingopyxis macrogoltabida]|uniref:Carnitine dehydratase n=1 Tax=Sphingopyxis macrogoltabida TaxID=33050 RepID=A0A2W5N8N8_SPHMC|nr:MAG: carnitine dehydratase [Sphingopyxis macrogoltabida]